MSLRHAEIYWDGFLGRRAGALRSSGGMIRPGGEGRLLRGAWLGLGQHLVESLVLHHQLLLDLHVLSYSVLQESLLIGKLRVNTAMKGKTGQEICDRNRVGWCYLRFDAPGDIGVEVAAGGGAAVFCWDSERSCLVGEAEPVLVFIMPMLE